MALQQYNIIGDVITTTGVIDLTVAQGNIINGEVASGARGADGTNGVGVPTGGTSGQVLSKNSNADYDTSWTSVSAGGVTSVNGQSGVVVLDADDVGAVNKAGDTMSGDLNMGSNDLINASSVQFNITPTIPTYGEGHVYWDNQDHTLAIQQGIDDVTLQVGQEIYVRARNSTGSTITNGQVVYISGATGNRPNVSLAQANSLSTSNVIGIATHDIENNTDGLITIFGKINDLDTSSYADGATLYLSPTVAGAMTTTVPTSPNLQVRVATVTRSNPANGTILFQPQLVLQKADIGLGNVDNTSDVNKPISTATQTALDGKVNTGTSAANNQIVAFSDATGNNIKSSGFSTGSIVTLTGTQALTNKTINGANNTLINTFTLTTNGTSGAASYDGTTLNIPQYSGGGGGSGITRSVNVTSGNYSLGSTASVDYVYLVAGGHAGTLPPASGNTNRYTVKNNHTSSVTVSRAGTDTIDGSTSISINPGNAVELISNGTNAWSII